MMIAIKTMTFCLAMLIIPASTNTCPSKLLEVELQDYGWEADMGALDYLANEVQNQEGSTGYILFYGNSRGVRGEVQKRITCMKNYLLHRRGLSAAQVLFVEGGYRNKLMMEVWIIPRDAPYPSATPTVNPKEVRLKKGKIKYTCDI